MKSKDCAYIVNWQSVESTKIKEPTETNLNWADPSNKVDALTKIGHNLIFEKTNVVVSYGQESCGVQTHRYKNT
jgi:hypothetical protein